MVDVAQDLDVTKTPPQEEEVTPATGQAQSTQVAEPSANPYVNTQKTGTTSSQSAQTSNTNATGTEVSGRQLAPGEQELINQQVTLNQNLQTLQQQQLAVNKANAIAAQNQADQMAVIAQSKKDAVGKIVDASNDVIKNKQQDINALINGGVDSQGVQQVGYKNMKMQNYWEDKSTGAKILAAISVGLGSLGASLTHGGNTAADIIQNAIQNDYNRQKFAIEQAYNVVGLNQQQLDAVYKQRQQSLDALNAKFSAATDAVAAVYKQKLAAQGVPQAQIDSDTNINKLQQQAIDYKLAPLQRTEKEVKTSANHASGQILNDATGTAKEISTIVPPGVTKVDEDFAKSYADYQSGGAAQTQSSLLKLAALRQKLNSMPETNFIGKALGAGAAISPELAATQKLVNPDLAAIKQGVDAEAVNGMKGIFGGRVNAQEYQNTLTSKGVDLALSKAENLKRIDNIINEMRNQASLMNGAAQYFNNNKTLNGYKGAIPDMNNIISTPEQEPSKQKEAPKIPPGVTYDDWLKENARRKAGK